MDSHDGENEGASPDEERALVPAWKSRQIDERRAKSGQYVTACEGKGRLWGLCRGLPPLRQAIRRLRGLGRGHVLTPEGPLDGEKVATQCILPLIYCGPACHFFQEQTWNWSLKTARDPPSWGLFPRCCDGVSGSLLPGPGRPVFPLLDSSMLDVFGMIHCAGTRPAHC